ncbi:MAG: M48 family metalloprotease [Rhodospirillaceae bacterium]|nr:M48 family metalloprotease [Rhodospirillaceae bacterium]
MRRFLCLLLAGALALAGPLSAQAQQRLSLIRDAELEQTLRGLIQPVLEAAGVSPSAVTIYIVEDPNLNAFVAGGQNIFIYTGLLMAVESPEEVLGVMAHEVGHIAGGHLAQGAAAQETAERLAIVTTLLGLAAAAAAGSASGGAAATLGGTHVGQASLLSYSRGAEAAADQAALSYLQRTGQSAEGLLTFLGRLEDQELLPASRQVEYLRTHPITRDRVNTVAAFVTSHPNLTVVEEPLRSMFLRSQAKLFGYLQPQAALNRFPESATDVPSIYGRAYALYRLGRPDEALAAVGRLLAVAPNDPYFNEFAGQVLMESNRVAEALPHYQRAVAAQPNEPLLLTALAQSRLQVGGADQIAAAVAELDRAVRQPGGGTPIAWHLLATAYGQTGDLGLAAVALAEEALASGDNDTARIQAARALQTLPNGSPGHLRALDIQAAAGID